MSIISHEGRYRNLSWSFRLITFTWPSRQKAVVKFLSLYGGSTNHNSDNFATSSLFHYTNDLHIMLKLHELPLAWSVKKIKYWLKKKITLWNVIIKKVLFSMLPLQIAVPEENDSSWCESFALSLYNTWEIYHWAIATTSILKHSSCSVKDNYHQTFH